MERAEQHYLGLIVIQFEEVSSHPLSNLRDASSYPFKEFSYIVLSRFGGKMQLGVISIKVLI